MKRKKLNNVIIFSIIAVTIVLITGFIEMYKIGFKEISKSIVDSLVTSTMTDSQNPNMTVDITNIINDLYPEHEHVWYSEYDETNHWSKCSVCKEIKDFAEHKLTTTWALGRESCEEMNLYKIICSCGYGKTGRKPCVWNGTWESVYLGYNQHDRRCTSCNKRIYDRPYIDNTKGGILVPENTNDIFSLGLSERTKCVLSDGTVRPCGSDKSCVICSGPKFINSTHYYIAAANNKIRCQACGKERWNL